MKFGRSIIDTLDAFRKNELVEGLVPFFHAKGMHILFEGVETAEIATFLQQMGADDIHGF